MPTTDVKVIGSIPLEVRNTGASPLRVHVDEPIQARLLDPVPVKVEVTAGPVNVQAPNVTVSPILGIEFPFAIGHKIRFSTVVGGAHTLYDGTIKSFKGGWVEISIEKEPFGEPLAPASTNKWFNTFQIIDVIRM
jgi:hypothetical protein